MALDRTWYNTLVDDDGSGLTGSVWDKADVDSLMDATDAEIARLDAKNAEQDASIQIAAGNFVPLLVASGGGVPVYGIQRGGWAKNGKAITVSGRISIGSVGSLSTGSLVISGLPYVCGPNDGAIAVGYFNGIVASSALLLYLSPGTAQMFLYRVPAGGGTASVFLNPTEITSGFDCAFAGTYITV